MTRILLCFFSVLFLLTACGEKPKEAEKKAEEKLVLKPAAFKDLPHWKKDFVGHSLIAFQKSCARTLRRPDEANFSRHAFTGKVSDWRAICEKTMGLDSSNHEEARSFYEAHFNVYKVESLEKDTGLFTGYYEASLKGSLTKTEEFHTPLYKRPNDLVMVDLGDFRQELRGQRIAGRVIEARLKPYEDRQQIDEGSLEGQGLEIVWVNDAVDAFFLHIQGSGRILLEDGSEIRVGYDGQNGHPYHAIGRTLIERGYLTKEEVSLQTIRAWLFANPDEARSVLHLNPSYVFFRILEEDGPVGGEGVTLTPGRSLAVDYTFLPYGTPMYLEFENPLDTKEKISRAMIAQDTGGAIRGVIRGDVFWGYGEKAELLAGQMKSQGRYWLLLPKNLNTELPL